MSTLPAQIIDRKISKVESCRQTLRRGTSVLCHSALQRNMSITNPADCEVRSVIRFWTQSIANLSKCMGKMSCRRGMCVVGEGQTCGVKRDLDARLSSPRIWRIGSKLTFVKAGDSLLASSMKFCALSSTGLSGFSSDTAIWQTGGNWGSERNSCGMVKWTGGRILWQGDGQACTSLDKCLNELGLRRNINILWHDAWKQEHYHLLAMVR